MMTSSCPNDMSDDPFRRKWRVFFLVAVSIFMSTLDSSIVNVALPYMMQDLSCDIRVISWVVLIYLTTVSSLLLTFGRLSDIRGRKPIYIAGFSIFAAGSLFCALSQLPWQLIMSRAFQGLGAAMLMACSPALIVDAFPARERGRALGMVGSVVAAGLTTGPAVGGFLLDYFSWQYIFYINIPIGIGACLGAVFILKPADRQLEEPMDKTGSLFLAIILIALILFLTQMNQQGLVSFFSLGMAVVFIASLAGFIRAENRTDYPLLDFNLLKIKLFIFPVMASVIMFASLFVIIFIMPFFLIYPCGFSASKTGGIMIAPFLFLLVISPISGALYDTYGSRKICMTGMGFLFVSMVSLTFLSPAAGTISILWRTALAGIGTALFISPNNTVIMGSVPLPSRGIASGAAATARNLGMVLGVALAGLVFTGSFQALSGGVPLEKYGPDMEMIFMTSFTRTMIMGGLLTVAGGVVTFARGKEKSTI